MRSNSMIRKIRFAVALTVAIFAGPSAAQTVEYMHTDALGSVVAVTDSSGTLVERNQYEPYGSDLTGIKDGPGFTGHVSDAATGLSYMQQRYYDPGVGRFLSIDPIAARDTGDNFNRYAYAFNNPYRFTDPDGREGAAVTANVTGQCDHCLGNGPAPKGTGYVLAIAGAVVAVGLVAPEAIPTIARLALRTSSQSKEDTPSVAGVPVGRSPAEARENLEKAGFPGRKISNEAGTEGGTLHNVADKKMDVRVMDGGPHHPARVVTNRQGTKQPVNPADGKNFGNIPKAEQNTGSHIYFREKK